MQEVQNTTTQYILENSNQANDTQDKSTTDFQSYFSKQSSNKDESESEENTLTTYYQSDEEKGVALASYINTNTVIPVRKTEEEPLISERNKTLYESITEDNYLSYDEIKDLSYEQIVEIKDFVLKKDNEGNYIQRSFMDHDKKAGMLLGTISITQDSTFNKAIFNIAKNIDNDKIFDTFMFDITGTQFSDQMMAYPELQNVDYSKGTTDYLANKLASYQVKLDVSQDDETKEFYQDMINAFQGLTNQHKSLKGESIHDNSDSNAKIEALLKDLISVIKTGFTESELEYMEQLLEEIRKLLKEKDDEDSQTSNEEIEKQIKALEDAVFDLEKKILGVIIINPDEEEDVDASDSPESAGLSVEERLNAIEQKIGDMKSGQYNQPIDFLQKDEEEVEEEEKKQEDKKK